MIAPLLQAYRSLTRFATWVVGFYASPLLHVVFTSVIAAAGFAYGFARGHLPELNVTITQSLLLGLVIIVFIEVYLNDGFHRLGIRTFIPRVRFVNSMFEDADKPFLFPALLLTRAPDSNVNCVFIFIFNLILQVTATYVLQGQISYFIQHTPTAQSPSTQFVS